MTLGGHYAHPIEFGSEYNKHNGAEVDQGFAIRVRSGGKSVVKTLDHEGFPGVSFRGEYPIGKVSYTDPNLPVEVKLEAFSPFIPLEAENSALPATVMSFMVTNAGEDEAQVELGGWLQNATCPYLSDSSLGQRRNRIVKKGGRVTLLSTVEPSSIESGPRKRSEIVFADFEGNDWGDWMAEGDAFGGGPFPVGSLTDHQIVSGVSGKGFVNTHNTRSDGDSQGADNLTGTLTSPEFEISRKYITLTIAGGNRAVDQYVEVVVEGKSVAKLTGHNRNAHRLESLDVSAHEGKTARIQIIDSAGGHWGHIQADQIVFTDAPLVERTVESSHGFGSMALSVLNAGEGVSVRSSAGLGVAGDRVFSEIDNRRMKPSVLPLDKKLMGGLAASVSLKPGESKTIDFAVTWYFPDYHQIDEGAGQMSELIDFRKLRRHYAPWFDSAAGVAQRLVDDREQLIETTRKWNETWYRSSLPHWLLDRTFIALDCVASNTCHWFDTGRFWGWEGVDCCPGTCQHVWHYGQTLGRIFPSIERSLRTDVDFGSALNADGSTGHRGPDTAGSYGRGVAHDGHCGRILGAYREHLTSPDNEYLKGIYPAVKRGVEYLINEDKDRDGLLEGAQHNTLDATWTGPMGWISSLYLAALAAGEAMAKEMGENSFARKCRSLIDSGQTEIVEQLFDGEYFIHESLNPNQISSNKGCHIDQVLGQAWAWQVGLPRVVPQAETLSALNSLWKYNFAPDAAAYAMKHVEIEQAFRWYAMPGETGLLMCTWPKGGALEAIPGERLRPEVNPDVWTGPGGYFNECMNGFEYQVAAHMIFEGAPGSDLVEKGLAITRAVHDRYGASKRNPYNEIECSDHYARSMASYGVFLALCGFEYDGPKGHIGFAPRVSPESFQAPFTAAEGWGSFYQTDSKAGMMASLRVEHGRLRLQTVSLATNLMPKLVRVHGEECTFRFEAGRILVDLPEQFWTDRWRLMEILITP
jgi:hypothetical protein